MYSYIFFFHEWLVLQMEGTKKSYVAAGLLPSQLSQLVCSSSIVHLWSMLQLPAFSSARTLLCVQATSASGCCVLLCAVRAGLISLSISQAMSLADQHNRRLIQQLVATLEIENYFLFCGTHQHPNQRSRSQEGKQIKQVWLAWGVIVKASLVPHRTWTTGRDRRRIQRLVPSLTSFLSPPRRLLLMCLGYKPS